MPRRVGIPKKFTLVNRVWTVRFMTKLEMVGEFVDDEGACRPETAEIILRPNPNRVFLEHSFWHEYFHALAISVSFDDLNADEERIESMSGAHHQFMQTRSGGLVE